MKRKRISLLFVVGKRIPGPVINPKSILLKLSIALLFTSDKVKPADTRVLWVRPAKKVNAIWLPEVYSRYPHKSI